MFVSKKKGGLIIGAILLATVAFAIYFYYQRDTSVKSTLDHRKIVVIPFTNLTPNTETDYLGPAFSDEIIRDLNLVPNYEVIRGEAQKPNDNLSQSLENYRTKEKIDLAVIGTYAISPNEIDISTKLVNTFDKKAVYNKSFTVQNKDISTIPRVVSAAIITALGLSGTNPLDYLANPDKIDETAYRDYLKAVKLTQQSQNLPAIEIGEKVVEKNPKFYTAWIFIASLYRMVASDGSNPNTDYYEKAIKAAQKAQQLEPNNPESGVLLAQIATEKGDLETALKEFKNLPKNDINPASKLRLGAYITRYGGLLDEAVKFSTESLKYTPKSIIYQPELYYRGDYEAFKKSVTPTVDEPNWNSFLLGITALYQNDAQAMQEHFQDGQTYYGDLFLGETSRAILLHLNGKTGEGLKILQKLEQTAFTAPHFDGETLYYLVIAYSYLGDNNGAIRTFRKTINLGFYCYPYFLKDPMLDKLRTDEKFKEALESARQKHLKFKELYYSEAAH